MSTLFSRHMIGSAALAIGLLALVLSVVTVLGGPFAPQEPIAKTVGEIAADIRTAAVNRLTGQTPAPPPPPTPRFDIDRALWLASALTGALAIGLGVVSLALCGPFRIAVGAMFLGGTAVGFLWFSWVVMLIAGAILLASIIANIGDIIGDI